MNTRFLAQLSLGTTVGAPLTETRIRLLEAIADKGSISQAAKAVPLSYKAAWDAIDQINNLSEQPLVERATGGSGGGGTHLTPHGRRVIALYRALQTQYQATLDQVSERLDSIDDEELSQLGPLLQRLRWQTSARNQLAGRVEKIVNAGVESEVRIRLDATHELAAIITRESVDTLQLTEGVQALALIKSSSVMIARDEGLRVSARNQFWGRVSRVHEGPVNHEITLDLPGGRSLTAVITESSSQALELTPGVRACAFFKASSVLLARPF